MKSSHLFVMGTNTGRDINVHDTHSHYVAVHVQIAAEHKCQKTGNAQVPNLFKI